MGDVRCFRDLYVCLLYTSYAPVVLPDGRGIKEQLEILQKEGYTRLSIGETVYRLSLIHICSERVGDFG